MLLALVFAAWPLFTGLANRHEDFIYLYAGTRLYWSGGAPYDRLAFQIELAKLLGQPNPWLSWKFASAYPPAAFWLFLPGAFLPYEAGFLLWTVVLLACMAWLARSAQKLSGAPMLAVAAACALWPGAFHGAVMHRVAGPAVACVMAALVAFERKQDVAAGALLGAAVVWPPAYVLMCAALAARRAWRALGASTWLLLAQLAPYLSGARPWSDWTALYSSLAEHARSFAFADDQSLASAFVRVVRWRELLETPAIEPPGWLPPLRAALFALAALGVLLYARRARSHARALAGAAALAPLFAPYSHAGDMLWALPAFVLWAGPSPRAWGAAAVLGWLATPGYGRLVPWRWLLAGFWTTGAAALWAGSTIATAMRSRGSRETAKGKKPQRSE